MCDKYEKDDIWGYEFHCGGVKYVVEKSQWRNEFIVSNGDSEVVVGNDALDQLIQTLQAYKERVI